MIYSPYIAIVIADVATTYPTQAGGIIFNHGYKLELDVIANNQWVSFHSNSFRYWNEWDSQCCCEVLTKTEPVRDGRDIEFFVDVGIVLGCPKCHRPYIVEAPPTIASKNAAFKAAGGRGTPYFRRDG